MSNYKSLGSSPIGLEPNKNSMNFISGLGVSGSQETTSTNVSSVNEKQKNERQGQPEKKGKKKVVSYNLDVELINKVKSIANKKEMFYSSLVSLALKNWLANNKS